MTKTAEHFTQQISRDVWGDKYQFKTFDKENIDKGVEDTWMRIATALASAENIDDRERYKNEFYEALSGFKILPAGRITAGAGTSRDVTLSNCFVMNTVPDSMRGIFGTITESALTMQQGGGIGTDFSTIRPKGAEVKGVSADASGPLSFMDVWDAMCRTVMSAGSRRGAMMATMRCDHPDIEDFIEAKRDRTKFRMFNLSVLITDPFMLAVKNDLPWDLVFQGKVYKTIWAVDLWEKIMFSTYTFADPGTIFIDRINARNNLKYCELISATNPCGEVPLPPFGACLLGSINLSQIVINPFTKDANIDLELLRKLVNTLVRMLDNVMEVSKYPLPEQYAEAQAKRRIGVGVTGLADMFVMMNMRYGSPESEELTDLVMSAIAEHAYMASVGLAIEKGPFPLFDKNKFEPSVRLPDYVIDMVKTFGLRNSHLLAIAPTGTISLYANNVTSGIEPIFAIRYGRKILGDDGVYQEQEVKNYGVELFEKLYPGVALPDTFVTAQTLSPKDHIVMQSIVQKYVDQSISKTVNCPVDIPYDDFKDLYMMAYDMGCKGCTTYRPNDFTGSILSASDESTGVDDTAPVTLEGGACEYDPETGRYSCDQ
jgi:ribonucleoside-diphosphate reductase alpha chain